MIDLVCKDAVVKALEIYNDSHLNGHSMVNVMFNLKKDRYIPRCIIYRPVKDMPLDIFES